MEINTNTAHRTPPSMNQKNTVNSKGNSPTKSEILSEPKERYVPSSGSEKKVTYDKPRTDQATIDRLKAESERAYSQLKSMVEQLLRKQGMTFQDIDENTTVNVDEATRVEAQALIGEGGEHSSEKVSDRIVEFAIALSGGDKSKFETLKVAIEEGFRQAASVLGGELPEISQKTYDLVMEKLESWRDGE